MCRVSVGKAERAGSTRRGFAFATELIAVFLVDAHTAGHRWLTTKENSNQSCTWGRNAQKLHYYVKRVGSIVLKIISEKPTIPGRVPQPSSSLLSLLSFGKEKFLLWFMGPLLAFLCGNNPRKFEAPSHGERCHPPALAQEQPWAHHPPVGRHRNPLRAVKDTVRGEKSRINTQHCSCQIF